MRHLIVIALLVLPACAAPMDGTNHDAAPVLVDAMAAVIQTDAAPYRVRVPLAHVNDTEAWSAKFTVTREVTALMTCAEYQDITATRLDLEDVTADPVQIQQVERLAGHVHCLESWTAEPGHTYQLTASSPTEPLSIFAYVPTADADAITAAR